MDCPFCGCRETRVLDTRPSKTKTLGLPAIYRQRVCWKCAKTFSTYEMERKTVDGLLKGAALVIRARDELPK